MSLQALPILILNLGGEMMYILDQRLHAQNVLKDKTSKGDERNFFLLFIVSHDILL